MHRAAVQSPPCPMGIRGEHITEFERLLYVVPKYDPASVNEYTVKYDSNDATLFTVTGKKYSDRPVREFRDASGLPMFECHRPFVWTKWRRELAWRVRLPGNDEELVSVKTRRLGTEFDLTFRNVAVKESKTERDQMVTLEVRRTSLVLWRYLVTVDGRTVVDIRESMERNKTLPLLGRGTSGGTQPARRLVMEALVADDFDLALASLITVMVSEVIFSQGPYR
ncbi:hypothetical protein N7492_003810 [Penicillium capsulatum]|uniref:Tubby C-terminal domain-containing protein n=1 Tax=Penicillium capsulatum TaxID=69766 RepID=A0A9W9IPC5_9EURO|nr:hypothetical protein N7492_003810 [Penicillium capsulatum]KAJ6121606.1 hypothetical protein N7512_004071 [Penicillium capsulatum]